MWDSGGFFSLSLPYSSFPAHTSAQAHTCTPGRRTHTQPLCAAQSAQHTLFRKQILYQLHTTQLSEARGESFWRSKALLTILSLRAPLVPSCLALLSLHPPRPTTHLLPSYLSHLTILGGSERSHSKPHKLLPMLRFQPSTQRGPKSPPARTLPLCSFLHKPVAGQSPYTSIMAYSAAQTQTPTDENSPHGNRPYPRIFRRQCLLLHSV